MNFILFDGPHRTALLPFTFTRPVADIRIGITTIREKWEKLLGASTSTQTEDYLSEKFPLQELDKNIWINGSFVPSENLVRLVKNLSENQAVYSGDKPVAYFAPKGQNPDFDNCDVINYTHDDLLQVKHTWDIFRLNGPALERDFELLTKERTSVPISDGVVCQNPEAVFIEEGAVVHPGVSLNATAGPIYIGKNAEVMEGSLVRGPFALCEGSVLKMGAKIYGPTTVGPHSKVGGEVNNCVIFAYSNKVHDGFLGNAVIGEWCNLGAGTDNSNLKNNYAEVRLWDYKQERFARTGLQFCGLMMGDHSKCGIGTMFNTGTVVGVCANIFGSGFPRNYIPSYSWGGAAGLTVYKPEKAFETAKIVMARRGIDFSGQEERILRQVFERTERWGIS